MYMKNLSVTKNIKRTYKKFQRKKNYAYIYRVGDGWADGELVFDTYYCDMCRSYLGEDDPMEDYGWRYCPFCGSEFVGYC